MTALLDLPNDLLELIVHLAIRQSGKTTALRRTAAHLRLVHPRFVPYASPTLFTLVNISVKPSDFEDGQNLLWDRLRSKAFRRYAFEININSKAGSLRRLGAIPQKEEVMHGILQTIDRIEAELSQTAQDGDLLPSIGYFWKLQCVRVDGYPSSFLLPYLLRLAPTINNAYLSLRQERDQGILDYWDMEDIEAGIEEAYKRRMFGTYARAFALTIEGFGQEWIVDFLNRWRPRLSALCIHHYRFTQHSTDRKVLQLLMALGRGPDFQMLRINPDISYTYASDFLSSAMPLCKAITAKLARAWLGKSIKLFSWRAKEDWKQILEETTRDLEDEDVMDKITLIT